MHIKHLCAVFCISLLLGCATKPSNVTSTDPITFEKADFTNNLGMAFVWIKPGTFNMGQNEIYIKEHTVKLTKGFYMQTTEVTQKQWEKVMGNNPSRFKDCGANCPVEYISWEEVQNFIKKLNQMTGDSYRLPTESEWEYACRAGSDDLFCFGNDVTKLSEYAWHHNILFWDIFFSKTHPVAQKRPNAWGLYDLHGNVFEFCSDWMDTSLSRKPHDLSIDPKGPSSGKRRVIRGGSSLQFPKACTSAWRASKKPQEREDRLGFRLVLDKQYSK